MRVMKFISLVVVLLTISVFAAAQQSPAETSTSIRHVPIANTAPNSGTQMYDSYCAVCQWKRRQRRRARGLGDENPAN